MSVRLPTRIIAMVALTLTGCSSCDAMLGRKPNIVIILVDDQGHGDLASYGGDLLATPHTDAIARNGVRFTDGYASAPVCTASRAGLLTGRYQQRFGAEDGPDPRLGLPRSELTLAERLKRLGYATGMVGKWHLGAAKGQRPLDRGFDEFFGFLGGGHFYFPGPHSPDAWGYAAFSGPILRGNRIVAEPEYLTDAFGREAVSFIERHQDEPFFLYLAFNAVHVPLEAKKEALERHAEITSSHLRTYAAMTEALEDAVGDVLAALRRNDLEEDTLVVYLSDNGGHPIANTSRNGPLRGQKAMLHEGGIRVPYLMQWKGVIPANSVYSNPVIALDVHATALAAAGSSGPEAPKLDGVDLLPYLRGEAEGAPHEYLYWRYVNWRALRKGAWKLVHETTGGAPELYHLSDDIGERVDLASSRPDKLRELEQAYRARDREMAELSWVDFVTYDTLNKQGKWPSDRMPRPDAVKAPKLLDVPKSAK